MRKRPVPHANGQVIEIRGPAFLRFDRFVLTNQNSSLESARFMSIRPVLGVFAFVALAFLAVEQAVAGPIRPKNDNFSAATPLTGLSGEVTATTVGATVQDEETSLDFVSNTIWYRYTPPANGYLIIEVEELTEFGSTFLSPYEGTSLPYLFYILDSELSFDSAYHSIETIPVKRGTPIRLQFGNYSDEPGSFKFKYRLVFGGAFKPVDSPYAPSERAERWVFNENAGTCDLTVARVGGSHGPASVSYEVVHETTTSADVVSDTSGTLTFEPGETRKTVQLHLANDATVEGQERFTFRLYDASSNAGIIKADTHVYIDSDDGVPVNDAFANAIELTGDSGNATTPNGCATFESGEPRDLLNDSLFVSWYSDGENATFGQTIWYKWTATADGLFTAETSRPAQGGGTDKLPVGVLTGDSLADLELQTLLPDEEASYASKGLKKHANLAVKAGTTYYIALQGHSSGGHTLAYRFEAKSLIRFNQESLEHYESEGNIPVTIERIGSTTGEASVTLSRLEATIDEDESSDAQLATAPADFISSEDSVVFANGESEKTILIPISNDGKKEKTEEFLISLSDPSPNAVLEFENTEISVAILDGKPSTKDPGWWRFYKTHWYGILERQSGNGGLGAINLTVAYNNEFTGSVFWEGKKHPFKGAFPAAFEAENEILRSEITLQIPRKGLSALTLELRKETFMAAGYEILVSGSVTDGASTSAFRGEVTPKLTTRSYDYPEVTAGVYAMALEPNSDLPAEVRSLGVASIKIKPTGAFVLTGTLPDGTKLAGAGHIGNQTSAITSDVRRSYRTATFHVPLHAGAGQFAGTVKLSFLGEEYPVSPLGDGAGNLSWIRPALPQIVGPPKSAFAGSFNPVVSRHYIPPTGAVISGIQPLAFYLDFTNGGLDEDLSVDGSLNRATAKLTSSFPVALSIQQASGLFQGKFTPDGGKAIPYKGVILQNLNKGVGFFLNGNESGEVNLTRRVDK